MQGFAAPGWGAKKYFPLRFSLLRKLAEKRIPRGTKYFFTFPQPALA